MKCDCQLHSCYCSSVNVNPVETSTTMPRKTRKSERCWEIQFLESVKDHRICASCWAGQLEKYLSKHSSKISEISFFFFCWMSDTIPAYIVEFDECVLIHKFPYIFIMPCRQDYQQLLLTSIDCRCDLDDPVPSVPCEDRKK